MADTANSPVVEAQAPKFSVGDEVKLTVDGEQYNAVIKAVTPVGGGTASYTVERAQDGVTGFKSEKYVAEDRLEAKVSEEAPVEEAKVEEPKEAPKAPEVKEAPVTPEEPAAPAVDTKKAPAAKKSSK